MVPGTAASVSHRNLLEKQILRTNLRPPESETLGLGAHQPVF